MAGNPPEHTKFKKGQSGNPAGRPPDNIPKMLKIMTAKECAEIVDIIVKGSLQDLKDVAKNPKSSALHVAISSVVIKLIQKGDMFSLDKLLDRLIGKVKDKVEISGKVESNLSEEERMAQAESRIKMIRERSAT